MKNKYKYMRKIKSRAWIEKDKHMFYQNNQYLNSFIRRTCLFLTSADQHESYLEKNIDEYLMQYTGLKDRNGNEKGFRYMLKHPHKDEFTNSLAGASTELEKFEVIGNIYEGKIV